MKKLCIVVLVLIGIIAFILFKPSPLSLSASSVDLEINKSIQLEDYIKEVRGYKESEVVIDDSSLDIHKLGQYTVKYSVGDYEKDLIVNVVDTVAPTFDTINKTIVLNQSIKVEDLVENINDETKTTLSFKEDYTFDSVGEQKVLIEVCDEANNKTTKEATVTVVKDVTKPTISGIEDIYITKNKSIDYMKNIVGKDDFDSNPQITVDSSSVDTSKEGTYEVKYTIKDASGNINNYTRKVVVQSDRVIKSNAQSSSKIVYLTFDDGPSYNTKKILDILDKYNVKATFFVTGNGQEYNYLIKEAHDKGHTIGLHTYTHSYSQIYTSVDAYFNDLDKVGEMVKNEIGYIPHYIRFPGGSSNTVSRKYSNKIMTTLTKEVQSRGYQYYDWNVSTGDAGGNNVPVNTIITNATSSNSNNIVILAHDTASKNTTVEALPKIIEYYQNKGYQFKGISDQSFTPHHHVNN